MVATSSSNKTANSFIKELCKDFPEYSFIPGKRDHWSPDKQTITYSSAKTFDSLCFSVLHETAHAILDHKNYTSDIGLIKLEAEAWNLAADLGKKYNINIPEEHIQNCLDTYRDWLHKRSACPSCNLRVFQTNQNRYECFNCRSSWQVTSDRFSRSYRKTKNTH